MNQNVWIQFGSLLWSGLIAQRARTSYKGTVKNGVVVLPPEAQFPDSAELVTMIDYYRAEALKGAPPDAEHTTLTLA